MRVEELCNCHIVYLAGHHEWAAATCIRQGCISAMCQHDLHKLNTAGRAHIAELPYGHHQWSLPLHVPSIDISLLLEHKLQSSPVEVIRVGGDGWHGEEMMEWSVARSILYPHPLSDVEWKALTGSARLLLNRLYAMSHQNYVFLRLCAGAAAVAAICKARLRHIQITATGSGCRSKVFSSAVKPVAKLHLGLVPQQQRQELLIVVLAGLHQWGLMVPVSTIYICSPLQQQ
mmetsp:Transcript_53632/g.127792  ORF Transcript_53632/g.127792 Transcript_53632/m.127792 type:complete len:231 (-) Transcript_53632:151-843(-)